MLPCFSTLYATAHASQLLPPYFAADAAAFVIAEEAMLRYDVTLPRRYGRRFHFLHYADYFACCCRQLSARCASVTLCVRAALREKDHARTSSRYQ